MLKSSCFVFILFVNSCAMSPLTSPKSARTLGEGNNKIDVGLSPTPSITYGHGLKENLDVGGLVELQLGFVASVWGKYAFINNPEGLAVSLYGGGFWGSSGTLSKGVFLGPVLSYKLDWFEAFSNIKYNSASWDAGALVSDKQNEEGENALGGVNWDSGKMEYTQMVIGANFWFTEGFGLSVYGSQLYDSTPEFDQGLLPGVELMFHF